MNKIFTIILFLATFQISAAEKDKKTSEAAIPALGSVTVKQKLVKPNMEKLDNIVLDSLFARRVIQVPSLRKQTKRYRPASAPRLQTKLNWVFAY